MIRVAHDAALNLSGGYTIEFFVKFLAANSTEVFPHTQVFERRGDGQEYSLLADHGPYNEFVCMLIGASGGSGFSGSQSLPAMGQWAHVALVYDPDNLDQEASIYVDGVFKIGGNYAGGKGTGFTMIADLLLGGSSQGSGRHLDGLLDEIRISDEALDPSQFLNVAVPVPPEITNLDGVPLLVSVGSDVELTASFTDGPGEAHVATWDFGDGNILVTDPAVSPVTAVHAYAEAGIYTVELTVTDADGLSDTDTIVVVAYDPDAGFTTGGGWFIPDSESFIDGEPVTDTTSKANFGFRVKYKNGPTPDGTLEFRYNAGDINLHSTGTEWLVIESATKVRFKGEATINGEGLYTFKVTAEDNGEPGTNDTFKIEIWLGVVDTENGPPVPKHTAKGVLGGGNIMIHQN